VNYIPYLYDYIYFYYVLIFSSNLLIIFNSCFKNSFFYLIYAKHAMKTSYTYKFHWNREKKVMYFIILCGSVLPFCFNLYTTFYSNCLCFFCKFYNEFSETMVREYMFVFLCIENLKYNRYHTINMRDFC
jgi:hypothetical protein